MAVKTFSVNEVLTAADTNTYLANAGLVLITSGITVSSVGGTDATVSNGTVTMGSGNTSVTVSGAFSSTYDNYKILISGGSGSTPSELNMRLGSVTTNYHFNFIFTAWTPTVAGDGSKVATSFQYVGGMGADGITANIDVMSPNLAKNTRIAAFSAGQTTAYVGNALGALFDTTQYTSFTILSAAGTMTGGKIRVYGYRQP